VSGQPGYRRGDRIALEHTTDPHTRLRRGDEGTVTSYDPRLGQLNIRWDSGSTLAMLLNDGDRVHLITPAREGHRLSEMPGLARRQACGRDSLAADLGVAPDAPVLAEAAQACPSAAREEFLLEAARSRLQARPGSRTAGQAGDRPQDITDPATGLSRLLSERCSTCILRHGDKMHLGAEHTAAFVRQALDAGTYVVCHQTLTYGDHPDFGPAICRGFFDAYAGRSPALRLLQAFSRLTEVEPPQPQAGAR
jgi:hypothetical protein